MSERATGRVLGAATEVTSKCTRWQPLMATISTMICDRPTVQHPAFAISRGRTRSSDRCRSLHHRAIFGADKDMRRVAVMVNHTVLCVAPSLDRTASAVGLGSFTATSRFDAICIVKVAITLPKLSKTVASQTSAYPGGFLTTAAVTVRGMVSSILVDATVLAALSVRPSERVTRSSSQRLTRSLPAIVVRSWRILRGGPGIETVLTDANVLGVFFHSTDVFIIFPPVHKLTDGTLVLVLHHGGPADKG